MTATILLHVDPWLDLFTTHFLELMLTTIAALAASSGFWVFVERKRSDKNLSRRLLLGLAHDRIITLCMEYIGRGSITQEEYENLHTFLYKPYCDLGQNGSAIRLMKEIDKLPIKDSIIFQGD